MRVGKGYLEIPPPFGPHSGPKGENDREINGIIRYKGEKSREKIRKTRKIYPIKLNIMIKIGNISYKDNKEPTYISKFSSGAGFYEGFRTWALFGLTWGEVFKPKISR